MRSDNLLMVADSDHDANMLYAVRMFVPDPFIYLQLNGKCHIVMSDLEIDRARTQAPHCRALSLTQCRKKLQEQGMKKPGVHHVIRHIAKSRRINRLLVPGNFPLALAG